MAARAPRSAIAHSFLLSALGASGATGGSAPDASAASSPVVYLIDKPGTPQTVIKAAVVADLEPAADGVELRRGRLDEFQFSHAFIHERLT